MAGAGKESPIKKASAVEAAWSIVARMMTRGPSVLEQVLEIPDPHGPTIHYYQQGCGSSNLPWWQLGDLFATFYLAVKAEEEIDGFDGYIRFLQKKNRYNPQTFAKSSPEFLEIWNIFSTLEKTMTLLREAEVPDYDSLLILRSEIELLHKYVEEQYKKKTGFIGFLGHAAKLLWQADSINRFSNNGHLLIYPEHDYFSNEKPQYLNSIFTGFETYFTLSVKWLRRELSKTDEPLRLNTELYQEFLDKSASWRVRPSVANGITR